MSFQKNKIIIFLCFYILCLLQILSAADDYFSINTVIDSLDLTAEYNNRLNCMYIHKDNKSVLIMNFCNYVLFNGEKKFIPDFVIVENGQIMVPTDTAIDILNFFSKEKRLSVMNDSIIEVTDIKEKQKITERYYVYVPEKVSAPPKTQQLPQNNENSKETTVKNNDNTGAFVRTYKPKAKKIDVIIIDPGHGGKDPGAIGYNNIQEKEIVLSVGLMVQKKLKSLYPNKKIIMTRDKDIFIPLDGRSKIANESYSKYGNAMFVSIHVNSSRAKNSFGFETWYLNSDYKRDVVDKKKISDDENVANVVNLMINEEIYNQSKSLAKKIQDNLEKQIGYVSKNRGIKEEIYFVIKKSIMPAVLVEIGFNSNKYEAIRLTNYSYRNKIRDGICDGVKEFIFDYESK